MFAVIHRIETSFKACLVFFFFYSFGKIWIIKNNMSNLLGLKKKVKMISNIENQLSK